MFNEKLLDFWWFQRSNRFSIVSLMHTADVFPRSLQPQFSVLSYQCSQTKVQTHLWCYLPNSRWFPSSVLNKIFQEAISVNSKLFSSPFCLEDPTMSCNLVLTILWAISKKGFNVWKSLNNESVAICICNFSDVCNPTNYEYMIKLLLF